MNCKCQCKGATSSKGSKGDKGDTGAAGATGAAGVNGLAVLLNYTDATGVTHPLNGVETQMFLGSVLANSLASNGDELEMYMYMDTTGGVIGTSSVVRFKLAGLTIVADLIVSAGGTTKVIYKFKITKTAAGAQLWICERLLNGAVYEPIYTVVASAMDETIANNFEVTIQGVATGDQWTVKKVTLYKAKI